MTSKFFKFIYFCFIIILCPSATYAAIVSTPWVHTEASIGQPFIWSDIDEGNKSSSSVNSGGAVTGHYAFTSMVVNFDSSEEVSVDLDRELSKTVVSNHPLGQYCESYFYYEALADLTADYSWNLTYDFAPGYTSGIFEGGNVEVSVWRYESSDGSWVYVYSDLMGTVGYNASDGLYSDTGTFNLVADNTYRIKLNNSSALFASSDSATLQGTVSFDFNGAAVPIPSAIWLLGSGLIGIVGVRRKFKKA